jgi:iduronate 2-sulfatase
VSLLDIYPTLVELCNLPKAPKLEGNSIVPLIKKPDIDWDKSVLSSWYYKNLSVRSNNWHYIKYRDGSEELYNHLNDPGEHVNLANDPAYSQKITELQKSLPKTDALPAGITEWEGDKLDKRIESWAKNDSIPVWLR